MPNKHMNGAPAGAIGGVNDRGSVHIDSALFLRWTGHFVSVAGCTKDIPHILLMGGRESHKTLEVIDFAKEQGVTLITFPPRCTHRFHPINRTFFKSLRVSYSQQQTMTNSQHLQTSQGQLLLTLRPLQGNIQQILECSPSQARRMTLECSPSQARWMILECSPSQASSMILECSPSQARSMILECSSLQARRMILECSPSQARRMILECSP